MRRAVAAAMLGRRAEPRLSGTASVAARIVHAVRAGATPEEAAAELAPAIDARFAEWAAAHAAAPDRRPDAADPASLTDPLDRALVAVTYETAPAEAARGCSRQCLEELRGRRFRYYAQTFGLLMADFAIDLHAGATVGAHAFDLLTVLSLTVRRDWGGDRAALVAGIGRLDRLAIINLEIFGVGAEALDLRRMRLRRLTLFSNFGLVLGGRATEWVDVVGGVGRADIEASARTVTRLRTNTRGLTIRRAAGFEVLDVVDARVEVAGPNGRLRLRGGRVYGTLVADHASVVGTRGGRVLAKVASTEDAVLYGKMILSGATLSADEGSAFDPPGGLTLVIAPKLSVFGECDSRGEFERVEIYRGDVPVPPARYVDCLHVDPPRPSTCAPITLVGRSSHLASFDLSRLAVFRARSLGAAASGLVLDVLCLVGGVIGSDGGEPAAPLVVRRLEVRTALPTTPVARWWWPRHVRAAELAVSRNLLASAAAAELAAAVGAAMLVELTTD